MPSPNIILVLGDDWDYETFGFMGDSIARTQTLDQLKNNGYLFSNYYTPQPRCRPALASLLTGRSVESHRIYYNHDRVTIPELSLPAANSLPRILKDAGYATYCGGKWWEGDIASFGFDDGDPDMDHFVRVNQDGCLNFLNTVGTTPFFLWWAPMIPHLPHTPPQSYLDLFDPMMFPIPGYITTEEISEYRSKTHLLYAMSAWFDAELRRPLEIIKNQNKHKDTIVVFVSDNGWSHGLVSKGSPYDKGFRSPMVLYWWNGLAAYARGNVYPGLVRGEDVFQTILTLAGVTPPVGSEGLNIVNLMNGQPWRDKFLMGVYPAEAEGRLYKDGVFALVARSLTHKYVYWTRDVVEAMNLDDYGIFNVMCEFPNRTAEQEELYELVSDPYELTNRIADPILFPVRHEMRLAVRNWWDALPT